MSTPTLLQHAETGTSAWWVNGGTSDVITFGSNTAAGSLLVAFVKTMSNVALSSITDTQGNIWVLGAKLADTGGAAIQAAYALNAVGGTAATVTFNFAGAVAQASGGIAEFSNVQNIRDFTFNSTIEIGTGTSTSAASSLQLSVVGDLVISVCDGGTTNSHLQFSGPVDTIGSGIVYNQTAVQAFVDNDSFAWAYGIGLTNRTNNATWTLTNSGTWAAMIFTFAPPVPAQLAVPTTSDNFQRANQNPLAGNWLTWGSGNALKLASNAVSASVTTSSWGGSYWNTNSFGDDHYSEITIGATSAAGVLRGPAVRMSSNGSATNGYVAQLSGTGNVSIQKIVAGTATTLGIAQAISFTTGDVIRLSVSKNLLTMTQNGTVLIAIYDSTFITGGTPGMAFNQATHAIDATFTNWKGGIVGDPRFYQSTVIGHDDTNAVESGPFTAPNKAGSLLVCCTGFPEVADPGTAISDSQGNVWTKVLGNINGVLFGQTFFYCLSAKAGPNTVTITRTAAGHLPNTLAEYTSNLGWKFDSSTKNNGSSLNSTGTLTTLQANELLVGYLAAFTNNPQGSVPGAIYRNAWDSEIKLYDQTAAIAGSNTMTVTIAASATGLPTAATQAILLLAFAPIQPAGSSALANPLFATDAGPGSTTSVLLFSPSGLGLEVHVSPTSPATDYVQASAPTPQDLFQGVNPLGPADVALSKYSGSSGAKALITPTGVKFANPA